MAGTIMVESDEFWKAVEVSMESGLDGRNNLPGLNPHWVRKLLSQWSPA